MNTKRRLTGQGFLLTAWDEKTSIRVIGPPISLAAGAISEYMNSNLIKSIPVRDRQHNLNVPITWRKTSQSEMDIYTDASEATSHIMA